MDHELFSGEGFQHALFYPKVCLRTNHFFFAVYIYILGYAQQPAAKDIPQVPVRAFRTARPRTFSVYSFKMGDDRQIRRRSCVYNHIFFPSSITPPVCIFSHRDHFNPPPEPTPNAKILSPTKPTHRSRNSSLKPKTSTTTLASSPPPVGNHIRNLVPISTAPT